jgi:peptide chain release factor 2
VEELNKLQESPDFWNDTDQAQKLVGELKTLKTVVEPVQGLETALEEVELLVQMAEEEGAELVADDLEAAAIKIEQTLEDLEFRVMLGGSHDSNNAYVAISAGAGGVDACDWAEILLRMFTRWAERREFDVEMVERAEETEGGIRSAQILVKGPYAFGYLKAEAGVHRLVRISPFDAQARRQTSFSSVDVTPEVDEDDEIEIPESEIRVDTMRAGGAGGQHVNKTESAVRMTHIPTGVVVRCQNERSQHKNRATALKLLKAKLASLREAERDKQMAKLYGDKGEIAWGNQIRSYVMHPYQMVKDHRTNHEKGNIQAVLDGDLDEFMAAYLRQRGGAG